MTTLTLTKPFAALLESIKAGKLESRKQESYMFSILNGTNEEQKKAIKELLNSDTFEGLELSEEQQEQGLKWLLNLWKTPTGKERINNPFGLREQQVLENFKSVYLHSYYDASLYNQRAYYIPLYRVMASDGYGFEYHTAQGKLNIVG